MDITLVEMLQALKIAGGILFTAAIGVAIWSGLYFLAENDILITFCPEGELKAIMKGDSLHRFIHSVQGWRYNRDTDCMERLANEGDDAPEHNWWNRTFGIYWVGVPPFRNIYGYKFSWSRRKAKEKEGGEYDLEGRNEEVDSLFFQFPYALRIKNLETSERIPVDVDMLVTTRTVKPEKSLFKTHDWLAHLSGYVEAIVRDWTGNKTIAQITMAKNETGDESSDFVRRVKSVNENVPEANMGLTDLIGQEVVVVNFLGFKLSGEAGEAVRKATTRKYVAEQDAEGIGALATAEEKRVNLRYTAIEKHPHGAQIAMAEAIRDTNLSVLSIGGQGVMPAVNIPVSAQSPQTTPPKQNG